MKDFKYRSEIDEISKKELFIMLTVLAVIIFLVAFIHEEAKQQALFFEQIKSEPAEYRVGEKGAQRLNIQQNREEMR